MLTELGKRLDGCSENFKKELEFFFKLSEMKKKINENTIEGINSRLGDTEIHISNLKDRIIKIAQIRAKNTNLKKMRIVYGTSETTSSIFILGVPEGDERKGLKMYLTELWLETSQTCSRKQIFK